jgi:hypothetical protein
MHGCHDRERHVSTTLVVLAPAKHPSNAKDGSRAGHAALAQLVSQDGSSSPDITSPNG